MTEESLPMEYSITGFWNSETTSRKMWMLSASSNCIWLSRSIAVMRSFFRAIKNPQQQEVCGAGLWGIVLSRVVAYPIVRRSAQQHAQQATGMEHKLMSLL